VLSSSLLWLVSRPHILFIYLNITSSTWLVSIICMYHEFLTQVKVIY
jgi:hypothetical protein